MANIRWKDDVSYAMTPFKLLTWPIGVWPLQVYNIYSLLRCIFATCCVSLMVILPSMEIYMGCTDAEQSVDSLMLICCGILGIMKTIWFRKHARNLTKNYSSALNDYVMVEDTKHRAIMRKHAFTGRMLCCCMLGFSYFSCIIYALIPFLGAATNNQINVTHEDILEYTVPSRCAVEYFFNAPARMHTIMCLIEAVSIILTSTTNHGNDSMFINITLHVCGQVEVLKTKLINFDVTSPQVYERFITLIKRHSYLIRMARELADTINFVLIIQLFIISIQLCITGFQFILALKVNDPVMAGKSVMVQSTFLSQLTLYSFIGDYLKTQMEEVGLCIYQNYWYNFPPKIMKNLIFVIMRTETPVTLQAGNIVVNLSTYMSILKASISYSHYPDPMARERWKNDVAYAMTPFKLLAWPVGVWPLQVYNVSSLIRCILATCCMSLIVIFPSMEFHMGCTNAEQNIDGLMLACCGVLGVLKLICFRIYAKNLTDNYGSARNDYLTIENTEHRAIMRRHAFLGRIVSCFMVCFSYVSVMIYSLIPLLGEEPTNEQDNQINITDEIVLDYPMPSRCALEYLHVPTSMYKIICLLEFIVLVLTCTCNHGNDSLFLNITLHMCGQVKILKANFIDFGASSPQIYNRFNDLIQRHNYLIELAKELAESISFVLLTQLFISSVLLCIMGFQFILALKAHNIVLMGKSCMVLCTFLTQLSVYSFVGDYLKSQMEEVGLYIYQSTWYDLPVKLAKNLIFIIMRTRIPVKLQAGNFIVVNLATYMSILKTSISYLSVLRVMIET
ncbi:uncharacterized protein LOC113003180 [Solenopsis invicta]|uniref:uncharacterized protein LOC113003180 n=1 Tax=Solenopsis invicta TaxID=13686 RepID=UPI00193D39B1|nr:uncharacterized protein LOC113003180 [Solenopsis invicta]